jgi:hypothetical protein
MTAQLPDTMEIANFFLPGQHWQYDCGGVCLPPFLAKARLLLEQSFSKSFDRISHGDSP